MAEPAGSFTAESLLAAVMAASEGREGSGRSGSVALLVAGAPVGLDIVDGRVVGPAPVDGAPVRVPVTADQLSAIIDGSQSLAQSFMRGDVKPEGATGPLLALIELFEDADFRHRLAAAIG